jgi:hypothetical protein
MWTRSYVLTAFARAGDDTERVMSARYDQTIEGQKRLFVAARQLS